MAKEIKDEKGKTPFSNRLRGLRMLCGLSQKAFAAVIGVTQQTYYHWEAGNAEPSITHLKKILAISGVPSDLLLNGVSRHQADKLLPAPDLSGLAAESQDAPSDSGKIGGGEHGSAHSPIKGHIEAKAHPLKISLAGRQR